MKTKKEAVLLFAAVLLTRVPASAQTNTPVARVELRDLAAFCSPRVHPDTIEAITRQESAFYPYALSINYPQSEANRLGYKSGFYQLSRQPKDRKEAEQWTRWFLQHGQSVSIGLMQVSSEQASRLGIEDPLLLFDPCINIAAGAVVLQDAYRGESATIHGLAHAFRLYNAGPLNAGKANSYAEGVIAGAPAAKPSDNCSRCASSMSHH